ncbi:MAG: 50S ribosomal protein L24 [Promethearchaeota archaeon]
MKPSKKPSKQRKALFKAPLHQRERQFNARLDVVLVDQHNVKRLPIRVNDTVRVMQGQFKDFEGKVLRVDRKNYKVILEEVTHEKADGSIHYHPIHPSKLMITKLGDIDVRRQEIIDRRNIDNYRALLESKTIGKKKKSSK